jgi:undecaprenyl phosphate N,N'-diacetylbacillosamine 1-phosphate transferase
MNKSLSVFLAIITTPLIIVTSILVFLSIGRPIIFKQERIGRDAKVFTLFKFRTMKGKDDIIVSDKNYESRTTYLTRGLRKLKLDELPQLINVYKNEMNVFGPRALYYDYYIHPSAKYKNIRGSVAPGIIGLAQVLGLDHHNARRRLACDILYIRNNSFILKIKIIVLLFFRLVRPIPDNPTDDLYTSRREK